MSARVFGGALAGALLVSSGSGGSAFAQTRSTPAVLTAAPPVTWCASPAANPDWAVQTVYLTLREHGVDEETGARSPRFTRDVLTDVLMTIVAQYGALHDSSGAAAATSGVPAADVRYSPGALFGHVKFEMNPRAEMGSPAISNARDSTLMRDLQLAVQRVADGRRLATDSPASERHTLELGVELEVEPDSTPTRWPLFSMNVPRTRPVVALSHPSRFPNEYRGWSGTVRLNVYVDAAGRPEPKTITAMPSINLLKFDTAEQRTVYLGLVKAATRMIELSKFSPAERFGCKVRQLIQVPFEFETRGP